MPGTLVTQQVLAALFLQLYWGTSCCATSVAVQYYFSKLSLTMSPFLRGWGEGTAITYCPLTSVYRT